MDIEPVILIDTREKEYSHISTWLFENDISFAKKKLDAGDYTAGIVLENGKKKTFENEIIVERKNSLDELSQNIGKHRERFEKELSFDAQLHLVIEDGSWKDVFDGNYRSNMNSQSFIGSLLSFLQRYNIHIHMVEKEEMGKWMYNLFYYYIREGKKEE